ncbi:MAG: glycosyltransferase family 2 protein [Planctomycetota bacterium]
MIAKNEERFLADCLASAAGLVQEMILVDTGSTDRTVEIARSAGARVVSYAWNDDFAAARNVGVALAKGSHVLVLDADERLGPGAAEGLQAAALDAELLLGSLPLHNASSLDATHLEVVTGAKRIGAPVFVPRFFPNLPELRFTRRVHETLTVGFNRLHALGRGKSKAVAAPLIHYGDVPALRAGLGKDVRNELLLRRSLQEDPSDGELAGYLVVQLLKVGRLADAREVGEHALAPFLRAIDGRPPGQLPMNTIRLGYALSFAQSETGAPDAALQTAREAASRCPHEHPNLVFAEAHALEKLDRLDEARARYERCLALDGQVFAQPVLPGLTGDLTRLRLADIALRQGAPERSLELIESIAGSWAMKGTLLAAEAHLAAGDPARAMERLAPLVDMPTLPPDFHALAHRALTALGQEAAELRTLALDADTARWIERRRRAPLEA